MVVVSGVVCFVPYLHLHATACKQIHIAQVEEAAKLANAHEFVSAFPMGYRTMVGERGQPSSLPCTAAI